MSRNNSFILMKPLYSHHSIYHSLLHMKSLNQIMLFKVTYFNLYISFLYTEHPILILILITLFFKYLLNIKIKKFIYHHCSKYSFLLHFSFFFFNFLIIYIFLYSFSQNLSCITVFYITFMMKYKLLIV